MHWFWWPPNEAVWVRLVCSIEHHLTPGQNRLRLAEVNHGRGQQADAGVAAITEQLRIRPVE